MLALPAGQATARQEEQTIGPCASEDQSPAMFAEVHELCGLLATLDGVEERARAQVLGEGK